MVEYQAFYADVGHNSAMKTKFLYTKRKHPENSIGENKAEPSVQRLKSRPHSLSKLPYHLVQTMRRKSEATQ